MRYLGAGLVGVLIAVGVVAFLIHSPTEGRTYEVTVEVPEFHWVEAGQSLWTIANTYWPGQHTGKRVFEIKTLNPQLGRHIYEGQRLRLREAE